ncbi:DUF2812 domain-containing protein [Massilia sp. TSP1-1-2]|uniref:DUF2812 domain-containing protein n=1 Tax=unclassified Massilia TaxID=2609279 RepID=UPI003CFAF232
MSEITVTKYKWFWADQDLEQEQWLREMARNGLHLTGVAMIRWTFVKGEPSDVVYRVDYSSKGRHSDYNRLIEDAGWECAATAAGWHYWRKRVVAGQAPEIFTDNESKIARFRLLLAVFVMLSMPSVMMLGTGNSTLQPRDLVWLVGFVAFFLYSAVRLLLRIRRLHNAGC